MIRSLYHTQVDPSSQAKSARAHEGSTNLAQNYKFVVALLDLYDSGTPNLDSHSYAWNKDGTRSILQH